MMQQALASPLPTDLECAPGLDLPHATYARLEHHQGGLPGLCARRRRYREGFEEAWGGRHTLHREYR